MSGFQILIVDDDPEFCDDMQKLLEGASEHLVGPHFPLIVHRATNQVDAERAVEKAPPGGFDLILLDRKYPRQERENPELLGEIWLPTLRRDQPNAAIAVLTIHNDGQELSIVVQMLRNHDADEFIPKNISWPKILERLQSALWNRSRRIRERLQSLPLPSEVAKVSAQDLSVAISLADSKLHQLFNDVSRSEPENLSNGVFGIFSALEEQITRIANILPGQEEKDPIEVDCAVLAKEYATLFERQLELRLGEKKPKGRLIVVDVKNDSRLRTYRSDLQKALTEVLQNAVEAVIEGEVCQPGAITITVEQGAEDSCIITVHDQGKGFPQKALDSQFQPGSDFSYWEQGEGWHKGMGLYAARRLMHGIGGDILVRNAEEDGAEVQLIIKDWGREQQ